MHRKLTDCFHKGHPDISSTSESNKNNSNKKIWKNTVFLCLHTNGGQLHIHLNNKLSTDLLIKLNLVRVVVDVK